MVVIHDVLVVQFEERQHELKHGRHWGSEDQLFVRTNVSQQIGMSAQSVVVLFAKVANQSSSAVKKTRHLAASRAWAHRKLVRLCRPPGW